MQRLEAVTRLPGGDVAGASSVLLAQFSCRLENVDLYLREVASRLAYRYLRRSHWAVCFQDYRRLARHPLDQCDEYFRRSTVGSVLVPFVRVGLERLGAVSQLAEFEKVVHEELGHMTQQVWVPHEGTDDAIWRSGQSIGTGVPVPSLQAEESDVSLSTEVAETAAEHGELLKSEALQRGMLPLFLTACRHHRLPMPPHLWFECSTGARAEEEPVES